MIGDKLIRSPLTRHLSNPILTPEMMPFACYTVFNAGAVWFNGKYLLLLRVENLRRETEFYVATSRDGVNFEVSDSPINYPLSELEQLSSVKAHRFDMRITPLDAKFYVCHATYLQWGSSIGMAETTDFVNFKPIYTSMPANRNAVLFPEKIRGLYCRLERPQDIDGSGRMWVSYSPDLRYWGDSMPLCEPTPNWSLRKTGSGIVPIKTEHGWLEIYHGTVMTASTENYHLGVMLLDLKHPEKIIAAPKEMILAAELPYECMGQVPNVVFTSGAILQENGVLNVYYAGADTRMCLAQANLSDLIDFCINNA
ncbi:MAG: glycoside hydrolase family 130 protein [Lentisphaerota bacterium]